MELKGLFQLRQGFGGLVRLGFDVGEVELQHRPVGHPLVVLLKRGSGLAQTIGRQETVAHLAALRADSRTSDSFALASPGRRSG